MRLRSGALCSTFAAVGMLAADIAHAQTINVPKLTVAGGLPMACGTTFQNRFFKANEIKVRPTEDGNGVTVSIIFIDDTDKFTTTKTYRPYRLKVDAVTTEGLTIETSEDMPDKTHRELEKAFVSSEAGSRIVTYGF